MNQSADSFHGPCMPLATCHAHHLHHSSLHIFWGFQTKDVAFHFHFREISLSLSTPPSGIFYNINWLLVTMLGHNNANGRVKKKKNKQAMCVGRQNKTNLFLLSVLTNQKHAYMNRTTPQPRVLCPRVSFYKSQQMSFTFKQHDKTLIRQKCVCFH